jgi:hypothetical protein
MTTALRAGGVLCLLLAVMAAAPSLGAGLAPIVMDYQFAPPEVARDSNGFHRVSVAGLSEWGPVGGPVLPHRGCFILLPPNREVAALTVTPSAWITLPDRYQVAPGQRPIPLSYQGPIERTPPDPAIYTSHQWFPAETWSGMSVQRWRGHQMLALTLTPVRYLPASGQLQWASRIRVRVDLQPMSAPAAADSLRVSQLPEDIRYLRRHVDNPQMVASYDAASDAIPTATYDYVIITSTALQNASGPYTFQDLVADKQAQGMTATIVTTEYIYANYAGVDNQAKIREFIKYAYNNWGTHHLLLGGDADGQAVGGESEPAIVPARGFTINGDCCQDPNIPADMYYGCLDGTFDNNGNGQYGEPDDGVGGGEVDLLAEVHVGRACVDSDQEVSDFVRKTLEYEAGAAPRPVWMVGEYLGFGGVADWGGNYKDEIKDGCNLYGYTTMGFLNAPGSAMYDLSTLYDRDWPGNDWPKAELIDTINSNIHIINHLGHANNTYVMKLQNYDVDAFTNTSYFFGYSQGCYAGAFDNRDIWEGGGYYIPDDCISEHLTVGAHGAVGFIANSRYGWGASDTNGPSQHFDRDFWDAVLGENIMEAGAANDDSKWDQVQLGYVASQLVARWCCYETNLFGDPALVLKVGLSSQGWVRLDRPSYAIPDTVTITVGDVDLDLNPLAPDTALVQIASTTETTPESLLLTETGNGSRMFVGDIPLAAGAPAADGQLQVANGDLITVTYIDANDGMGGTNVLRTATALVDTAAPIFAGLSSAAAGDGSVTLTWSAASDPSPPVHYHVYRSQTPGGQDFGSPLAAVGDLSYQDTTVTNWQTYYYVVRASDALGNEETNTTERSATPRAEDVAASFPLDTNPGWTCQGLWWFGVPYGSGSSCGDPTSGHTGANVYGYNLFGDYTDSMSAQYLTSTPIDCSRFETVSLHFWRWLGVEDSYWDHAAVEASNNGSTWMTVWEHAGGSFCDGQWVKQTFDLTSVAAGKPAVRLRWRMGPTDGSVTYPGWNIDDIEVRGMPSVTSLGTVTLDRNSYAPALPVRVRVLDLDMNTNPAVADQVTVQMTSTTESTPEALVCTELGVSSGIFQGTISLGAGAPAHDGILQVADGDTITASYFDADDGTGHSGTRTDTAGVDGTGPTFAGLTTALPGDGYALLSWSAANDMSAPVSYNIYRAETPGGQNFGAPIASAPLTSYRDETVTNGLVYYYVVRAQDAVGNEESNTVEKSVRPRARSVVYSWNLDTVPAGWAGEGLWAYGRPTGGGDPCDPASGHTGLNVLGYNLHGNYPDGMWDPEYLTTSAIDCSWLTGVALRFWRWLGIEDHMWDQAAVEASLDGSRWQTVWENPDSITCDGQWVSCMYDLSSLADQHPTLYLRWRMGPTDYMISYEGWNLDDIEIWGIGGFRDVPFAYWSYSQIMACYYAGIVTGYPDHTYRPAQPVDRAQMAVYVARALARGDPGVPPGPPEATFSDVPNSHWAYKYIEYAVDQGVVQGYPDGTYVPTRQVDRGQMAVFIARALVAPAGDPGVPDPGCDTPPFTDVACDHWARRYIQYIKSQGVSSGYGDGSYRPAQIVSRGEMAVYVQRAFDLPG